MKEIKTEMNKTEESIFSIMSSLSTRHSAINLGQGFPNFDCPEELKRLVDFYLNDGKNQYCPMPGLLSLRQVLSEKINRLYDSDIDPAEEITITAGATQAIFTAISALIEAGDEVIIIEPAYDSYRPSILLAGGTVIAHQLEGPYFKIDWDEIQKLVSEKTKMIIINSPNNPTGKILSIEDIEALQAIVLNDNLYLLSDEVYEHLVYDNENHESVIKYPELFKRSICTFSFGKTFHNTGWKMGYCVAPKNIMQKIRNVHQWIVFSVNSFVQYALADFLKNESHYLGLPQFYSSKRDFFNDKMKGSRLKALDSKGTYFQLFDYSEISDEDEFSFAKKMITEHGVASIPVSSFYHTKKQNNLIRLCFAKTEDTLAKAAEKLRAI